MIDANQNPQALHALVRRALTAVVTCLCAGCVTVGPGEVAVVWTPGGMSDKVFTEGQHGIGWFDKTQIYDARSQTRDEKLEVLASNGLRITLDTSVRYRIIPEQAVLLDEQLGPHYYSTLIGPTIRSQARRVVGRYTPEEIYSTQREAIEREIREGVEKAIQGRHILLEAVLIRNVALPDAIQQAINNKLEAEQQTLKMKYVIERSRLEGEQRLIEAKAEADRAQIRAQAEANAKVTAARATSEYERLVGEHLNDSILKWQQIQALDELSRSSNAKVILLGQGKGGTPLLEIK
jgi:regulator of protease activity HflC (stomatin/prohibitin superfamily)